MPLFGKRNPRSIGEFFDRTCVRPLNVAFMAAPAGMQFGRLGSHWFKELQVLEPQVLISRLELRSLCHLLIVDRSPRPCGHLVS